MNVSQHSRRAAWLISFFSLLACWFAETANANGLISGHYVFRATYAPVCLNGTYPVWLGSVATDIEWTVKTDASGQLTGTLDVRGLKSNITGTISRGDGFTDLYSVYLQAQTTGPNPAGVSGDFYAYLHGTQFLGDAGDADGDVRFIMNVPSASPLVVTFDVNLTVNGQGQITGSGTASSCAAETPVTVTGTNGTNCTLHIVGTNLPQFVWDGSGPATSFGFLAAWNAQGYGFTPSGAQLPIFTPNAPSLVPYVTSRKNHLLPTPHIPAFATCDVPLNPGVECRTGGALGNHQVVITFPKNITLNPPNGTPAVRVSSGTGSVSAFLVSNNEVIVNLTGVPEAQRITVTLSGVSDGTTTANISLPIGFLLGDTTGNGFVNSSDIAEARSQSGQALTFSNCRTDVTLNGVINSSDISLVQSKSGTALPAAAPSRSDRPIRSRRLPARKQ
jgi:hypothetical protein